MNGQLGVVFFTEDMHERPVSKVRDAAHVAGIPQELVRDVRPKSAFIRATQELKRRGIIAEGQDGVLRDKIQDAEGKITFQFSKRFVESSGATYDKQAVITWDQESGMIACDNQEMQVLAMKLLEEFQAKFSTTDINYIIKKFIEAKCRRVAMRDAVYFIPQQYAELAKILETFYTQLGFTFMSLDIGVSHTENVFKAVVKDLAGHVHGLQAEIAKRKESGDLTSRVAKNRIKELKKDLGQYKDLALCLHKDLGAVLKAAGDAASVLVHATMPVDGLIQMAQRGEKIDALALDLFKESLDHAPVLQALEKHKTQAPQVDLFTGMGDKP